MSSRPGREPPWFVVLADDNNGHAGSCALKRAVPAFAFVILLSALLVRAWSSGILAN